MSPDLDQFIRFSSSPPPARQASETFSTDVLGNGMRKQIDFMASHMFQQLKAHEAAEKRTALLFAQFLNQLEEAAVSFQEAFAQRDIPMSQVYVRIDADRSVGTLHLLWHTISFATRGNTQPMALKRQGREPLFTGRIVAFVGDYLDNVLSLHSQEMRDLLEDELASLYVPASPVQPAVMTFRHSRDELFFHQAEATQQFLVKVLESVCGGGFFHENTAD